MAWSEERLLESVTGPAGTTSFTYDTEGQRLLRTSPDGTRTLYMGSHEVHASADGTAVDATRLYTYAGELIATRTASGVNYLLSDQQGSIEAAVPSVTSSIAQATAYLPYGGIRAGNPGTDTDRGWLGESADASTSLTYLNARYYDPTAGVFISPDPLIDPTRPKSINPYAYGHGNPSTHTDASGLGIPVGARSNAVVWDARFKPQDSSRVGAFAGNTRAMINYGIKPASVSRRQHNTYKPAYDATQEFWRYLANNPSAREYFAGVATLQKMHSGCPTAECAGLYRALAEVGAERLGQIAEGIERQRQQRIRIQAQQDRSLNSHVRAPEPDGGCSGWSLCQVGEAWDSTGGRAATMVNDHAGAVADTAWQYRSTILAVAGGVACTAATAGTGAAACTALTVAALANATVSTAQTTRNCGWRRGVATGVFEYSAAMPGLTLADGAPAGAVALSAGHGSFLSAFGDATGIMGSC